MLRLLSKDLYFLLGGYHFWSGVDHFSQPVRFTGTNGLGSTRRSRHPACPVSVLLGNHLSKIAAFRTNRAANQKIPSNVPVGAWIARSKHPARRRRWDSASCGLSSRLPRTGSTAWQSQQSPWCNRNTHQSAECARGRSGNASRRGRRSPTPGKMDAVARNDRFRFALHRIIRHRMGSHGRILGIG